MEKICARILLLGKTGVGKSSFINYFLGQNVAETGIGKPVTQELKEYEMEHNGMYLNVTDSKGMEVENSEKIKKDILDRIEKRNGSSNILEWYHTIFYCISVTNARIEKYEIELLRELKGKISQNIHIILTNCDNNVKEEDSEQIKAMKDKLKDELGTNIHIYKVCSVEMKKRNGTKIEPYGKEEIIKGVFELLWKDICFKIALDFSNNQIKPALTKFLERKNDDIESILEKNIKIIDIILEKINKGEKTEKQLRGLLEENIIPDLKVLIAQLEEKLRREVREIERFYLSYHKIISKNNVMKMALIEIPSKLEKLINNLISTFKRELNNTSVCKQIILPLYNIIRPNVIRKEVKKTLKNYIAELNEQIKKYNFEAVIYDEIYSMLKKDRN
ncbi:GTPase domain-containing protein [Fusobacterium varium]